MVSLPALNPKSRHDGELRSDGGQLGKGITHMPQLIAATAAFADSGWMQSAFVHQYSVAADAILMP